MLASWNRFCHDEEVIEYARAKLDESLNQQSSLQHAAIIPAPQSNLADLLHVHPWNMRSRGRALPTVKDVVAQLRGTVQNPIDLTDSNFQKATQIPLDRLKSIPIKFLKFAEDVRPPYIGTFTKAPNGRIGSRLNRNPFARALPETNYDYDSEAEWEEPGEGEDLDSEGEEELGDEEDTEEMEGFLDDAEADEVKKRRPILGALAPTCTGLCWEDEHSDVIKDLESPQSSHDLRPLKLDIILSKLGARV